MYWNEKQVLKDIAKSLNIDEADLHRLMKKLMIPTRSRKEARKLWWKQQKEKEQSIIENVKNRNDMQPL